MIKGGAAVELEGEKEVEIESQAEDEPAHVEDEPDHVEPVEENQVEVSGEKPVSNSRPKREVRLPQRFRGGADGRLLRTMRDPLIPRSAKDAMSDKFAALWVPAMNDELEGFRQLGTYERVPYPSNANVLRFLWVFDNKMEQGKVVRQKARLVAMGNMQKEGLDYSETFAPTLALDVLRLIIAWATVNDWELKQTDMVKAFLHSELQEKIYIHPPPGFDNSDYNGDVWLLKKSVYGLKQAGREFWKFVDREMRGMEFKRCIKDHSVWIRGKGELTVVSAGHVDDFVHAGPSKSIIDQHKIALGQKFVLKDMGAISKIVGITVERDRSQRTTKLSQPDNILKALTKYGLEDSNGRHIPTTKSRELLDRSNGVPLDDEDRELFQQIVGDLIYIANGSRPDIAHVSCLFSRVLLVSLIHPRCNIKRPGSGERNPSILEPFEVERRRVFGDEGGRTHWLLGCNLLFSQSSCNDRSYDNAGRRAGELVFSKAGYDHSLGDGGGTGGTLGSQPYGCIFRRNGRGLGDRYKEAPGFVLRQRWRIGYREGPYSSSEN